MEVTAPESKAVDPHSSLEKGNLKNVTSPDITSIGQGTLDDIAVDTVNAEHEYTPEQFKKLRRKIDLRLLPVMWVSKPSTHPARPLIIHSMLVQILIILNL